MESINGSINAATRKATLVSLRKVKCLVCDQIVFPPVMQCKNWHLVCNNCRSNLTSCPGDDCQEDISSGTRSGVSENFLEKYAVRCKYFKQGAGCLEAYLKEESEELMTTHETTCNWREVSCFVPGCNQDAVRLTLLAKHFELDHSLQPNNSLMTTFNVSEIIMEKKGIVNETCGEKTYKSISRYMTQNDDVFLAIFRASSLRSPVFELSTIIYPYYSEPSHNSVTRHTCTIMINKQDSDISYKWEGPLFQMYTLAPSINFQDETSKLKWVVSIEVITK